MFAEQSYCRRRRLGRRDGGSAGLSIVAIAVPVLAVVLVVLLVYLAARALLGLPRRAVGRRRSSAG
jgi:hypothetical protein